jgi:hypothetical protein
VEIDALSIPLEIRTAIIARDGEWKLVLKHAGNERLKLARVLANEFSLEMAAALKLLRDAPTVLATGTRLEISCLSERLLLTGATVEVRPL